MKVFGLTGGPGTGKSAAGRLLQESGIPVVDTDLLARQVVEPGTPALDEIRQAFGDGVVAPDGSLRRDEVARIVFANVGARETLERITHPRIRDLWAAQLERWRAESRPVAVVIVPLLFETGAEAGMEATLCVACSAATQRQRLLGRGWDEEQVAQRIAAQWPIGRKMERATHVVWTEGGFDALADQLRRVFPDVFLRGSDTLAASWY